MLFFFSFTSLVSSQTIVDWSYLAPPNVLDGCCHTQGCKGHCGQTKTSCEASEYGLKEIGLTDVCVGARWRFLAQRGVIILLRNAFAKQDLNIAPGAYYLSIEAEYDNDEYGETLNINFGGKSMNIIDLGHGIKRCIFSQPFNITNDRSITIKGTGGNSVHFRNYRLSTCIPNETGLVYCENGQPAVSNCPHKCTPEIVFTPWNNWQKISCVGNQTQERRERIEYDKNNCSTFQNRTYYEYRLVGPNYVNTSWSSWKDIGCSEANLLQVRNLTQYDLFDCATSQIFYEYRTIQANIVFSPWSEWQNLQCINSTHRNQSRFRIEYDANNLGCFKNKTHYEYRIIEESSCGQQQINPPTITIFRPLNNSVINDSFVFFNASSNQVINWTLYLNGTIVYLLNNSRDIFGNLNLSNNYYNLTFCGRNNNGISCNSVFFFVNASSHQIAEELYLRIISPEDDKRYKNSLILINFSTNGNSVWYNWNGTNVSYFGSIFVNFSFSQIVLHAWASNGTDIVYKNVTFYVEENKEQENRKTISSRSSSRKNKMDSEEFESETNKISYTIERIEDKKIETLKEKGKKEEYNINPILILGIILLILIILLLLLIRY